MTKVFISQPMKDRTDKEIIEERLLELGFNVTAHDDQFGKTRFIQAIR